MVRVIRLRLNLENIITVLLDGGENPRLDFENWIQITQKEISEALDIKKSNVSRGISLLENKNIILRGPKIGRTYAFRLNPDFGWKGKVTNLNDYRRKTE